MRSAIITSLVALLALLPHAVPAASAAEGKMRVDSVAATRAVEAGGAFAGSVGVAGRPSGTYVVVVRACYGLSNCGEATTTVSL